MKEVKIFILFEVVLALLKLLAGFVCHSYSMLASCLIEVVLIISLLPVLKYKDNNKFKGLLSSVWGFIILCLGLGMIFYIVISKIQKVSWFILLFIFLSLLARYTVGCFYTNANYRKKKGILGFCSVSSNTDFYITGIIFITFIFTKLSKLVELFKYFDKIGAIAISIFTIYIGMKIIKNSFNYLEEDSLILDEYKEEIVKRSEVKKFVNFKLNSFGGLRKISCNIILNDSLTLIDLTSFVVSLQDYLLKIANVVEINLLEEVKKKKIKVRSLKQDARNSGSGNSKKNTNKKHSKKKNKRR